MTTILETDQKNCFDEIGNRINCRNTLQDAEYKSRKHYFFKRFNVCKDFVEDRWTELIWHLNANLAEFPLTWKEAFECVQEVNDSATSGIKNWRLPTRSELFSLVSQQLINPALPEHGGKELNQGAVTWKEAIDSIKSLNMRKTGFNDWRLPNIRELDSLVDS